MTNWKFKFSVRTQHSEVLSHRVKSVMSVWCCFSPHQNAWFIESRNRSRNGSSIFFFFYKLLAEFLLFVSRMLKSAVLMALVLKGDIHKGICWFCWTGRWDWSFWWKMGYPIGWGNWSQLPREMELLLYDGGREQQTRIQSLGHF